MKALTIGLNVLLYGTWATLQVDSRLGYVIPEAAIYAGMLLVSAAVLIYLVHLGYWIPTGDLLYKRFATKQGESSK